MQRFVELTATLLNNIAQRFVRNNSMTASNFFQAVNYHPDESQILTTGTDRKITFWDAYDCQAIRLIDGSLSSEMNCLDITPDGEGFVSGGVDREVKLWNYDEGHCYFVGLGHSGPITKVIDPPFLHPLSPQFVCPKFPQILKGTFLWISLSTTNSILNPHLLLKLLFYVYTSPEIYTPRNTAAAVEHKCLEEHKRWDFYEVE
jgi:hypothetical protein